MISEGERIWKQPGGNGGGGGGATKYVTVGLWQLTPSQAKIFGGDLQALAYGIVPVRVNPDSGMLYIDANGLPPRAMSVYRRIVQLVPQLGEVPVQPGQPSDRLLTYQEVYERGGGSLAAVPPITSVIGTPTTLDEAWSNWQRIGGVDAERTIDLPSFINGLGSGISNAADGTEDFSEAAQAYWDDVANCFAGTGIGWATMIAMILFFIILVSILSGGTFAAMVATAVGLLISAGISLFVGTIVGFLICLIAATGLDISWGADS